MKNIVIVGGGQSAAVAALALRRHGFEGDIVIVCRENLQPYERPKLSKSFLAGTIGPESLTCLPAHVAEAQDLTVRLATECLAIDRSQGTVRLGGGEVLAWDRLVLATGGTARTLPAFPAYGERVHLLRTVSDAEALRRSMAAARSLVVIGAGWLGLEVAATARALGLEVDVVEAAPRVSARTAPPELSEFLFRSHADRGVRLHVGAVMKAQRCGADGVCVTLSDGNEILADIAVVAIGLVPESRLAAEAGLDVDDGIITDADGRTADPRIFAIGDCARTFDPDRGAPIRLESWQNANLGAARTAAALMGRPRPAPEIPWFWSDQFGVNVQILGATPDDAERIHRGSSCLYLRGGRLLGLYAVDAARDIAGARRLIADGARIDAQRAADPSIPLRGAVAAQSA
jgi:3-phenylpropionate/trans-cinnamate dioxygenase ferredoxin reductase subunit